MMGGCGSLKHFLYGGGSNAGGGQRGGAATPLAPSMVGTPGRGAANGDQRYSITGDQLDRLMLDYADRYRAYLVTAWQGAEREHPSALQRRDAHRKQLQMVSAMYDIVTQDDPFRKLVNATMVVTLQSRVYADEKLGHELFGEQAEPVMHALRKARVEIWEIAAKVMLPGQLQTLDYLIWDWRRRNPDVTDISALRFDALSASRSTLVIQQVSRGSGLLAPIEQVSDEVARTRALAERAFYMSKRLPVLANWQAQDAVNDVLAKDEVEGIATTLERLPQIVTSERKAVFQELGTHEAAIGRLLTKVRLTAGEIEPLVGAADQVVVDLQGTSASLRQTVQAVDELMGKSGGKQAADGKPFNVDQYIRAAEQFRQLAEQLDKTLDSANRLLSSPAWQARIADINQVAGAQVAQIGNQADSILYRAFWGAAILILLFFVLLGAYRYFSVRVASHYERSAS
jgi:hypothetical protein